MKKQNWWKVLSTFNLSFSLLVGLMSLWIVGLQNDIGTGAPAIGYVIILVALIGFISSFFTRKEILVGKVVGLIIGIIYIAFVLFVVILNLIRVLF